MHIANLNLEICAVLVDSELIEVDENGVLVASMAKLCSPPAHLDSGRTRFHLLRKLSICGKSADGVIEVEKGDAFSIIFLFDLIEFFEVSILESKIIKLCEKSWNLKFMSSHPSKAFLDFCERGNAVFFYDAKQGDLSLEIKFKRIKYFK